MKKSLLLVGGLLLLVIAGCASSNQDEINNEKLGQQAEMEGAREGNALAGQMKSTRPDGQ